MTRWKGWTISEIRGLSWYPHRAPPEGRDAFEAAMLADPGPHASAYAKAEWHRAHPCFDGVVFRWPPPGTESPIIANANPAPNPGEQRDAVQQQSVVAVPEACLAPEEEPLPLGHTDACLFPHAPVAIARVGFLVDVGLDVNFLLAGGGCRAAFWEPAELCPLLTRTSPDFAKTIMVEIEPDEIAGIVSAQCGSDFFEAILSLKNGDMALLHEHIHDVAKWSIEHRSHRDQIGNRFRRAILAVNALPEH